MEIRKKNNNEKKKFGAELIGLLPNYIVKKKNCIAILKLYCKQQERRLKICIAVQQLYCDLEAARLLNCVATRPARPRHDAGQRAVGVQGAQQACGYSAGACGYSAGARGRTRGA